MTNHGNKAQPEFSADPAIAKRERKIRGIIDVNVQMIEAVSQAGIRVNYEVPRIEHMLDFLVDAGVITYEQRLDEEEKWQLKLRGELQPAYEHLKTAMRMSGQDMQTPSGIIIPGQGVNGNKKQ